MGGVEVRSHIGPDKPIKELPITLLDLDDLVPHEMIIEHELEWFIDGARESNSIHWGMLVAEGSNLILDGHHRTAGLKKMGFKNGPAHVIDYLDDTLVTLDTWYPRVNVGLDKVVEQLREIGLEVESVDQYDMELIDNREVTAYIGNIENIYQVNGNREDIFRQVRDLWIDDVVYYDDPDMCIVQTEKHQTSIISWSYTKQEILGHVSQGIVHLPKTTRHELSFQIKRTNFPLDKLDRV